VGRYLIVANQTLGGKRLDRAVQDRIDRGDSHFFVVVPMTTTDQESDWTGGYEVYEGMSHEAIAETLRRHEAMSDEARHRAEHRVSLMIDRIRSAGGEADGTIGDADPTVAVRDALQDQPFDEVIISTLPTRISRWLKMDLPSRISRMTETPVTTIEAED
jgi:hypothetical protein